jgi:hypothetical protein
MLLNESTRKFPYYKANYEEVPCNLCKGRNVVRLGNRDRNSLRVRMVICKNCGLIFISPRMTPEWYARHYNGENRHDTFELDLSLGRRHVSCERVFVSLCHQPRL